MSLVSWCGVEVSWCRDTMVKVGVIGVSPLKGDTMTPTPDTSLERNKSERKAGVWAAPQEGRRS